MCRSHGLAIYLDQIATKVRLISGLQWEAVSKRIVKTRLQWEYINVSAIADYAPINTTKKQMGDASDKSYSDLQKMLLIMEDANARVGSKRNQIQARRLRPHTTDVENGNRTRLIEFCSTSNLIILNIFF